MKKSFLCEGKKYIARKYSPKGRASIYGEIVLKDTDERPLKPMKAIAREYLAPYGIEVSTVASVMTTHMAVNILIDCIRKNKK